MFKKQKKLGDPVPHWPYEALFIQRDLGGYMQVDGYEEQKKSVPTEANLDEVSDADVQYVN